MKTFIAFLVFIYTTLSLSSQIITSNKKKMVGVVDSLGKELIPFKFTKIEESSFLVDKYNELTKDPNQQDKLYKYYTGGFAKDLDAAKNYKIELQEKGFQHAFVVAFQNGQRINLEKAIKLAEK